jgi:TctA family transporter
MISQAAFEALLHLVAEPMHLLFLLFGVLMGLALGAIPGLGGLVGLAILLPFTYLRYHSFGALRGSRNLGIPGDDHGRSSDGKKG